MLHADDALPRDLAAKNRGLNRNATLNCRGIQHFCATAIKLVVGTMTLSSLTSRLATKM